MKMRRNNHTRSGFSLMEVLLGIVVLSIAIMSLARAVGNTSDVARLTDDGDRVMEAMDNLLEEIMSYSFEQAGSFNNPHYTPDNGLLKGRYHAVTGVDPWPGFDDVLYCEITMHDTYAVIELTARWLSRDAPMTRSLTFYHVNRGG